MSTVLNNLFLVSIRLYMIRLHHQGDCDESNKHAPTTFEPLTRPIPRFWSFASSQALTPLFPFILPFLSFFGSIIFLPSCCWKKIAAFPSSLFHRYFHSGSRRNRHTKWKTSSETLRLVKYTRTVFVYIMHFFTSQMFNIMLLKSIYLLFPFNNVKIHCACYIF